MAFHIPANPNDNKSYNPSSSNIVYNNIQNTEFKNKLKEKIYANFNDFALLSQQITKASRSNEVINKLNTFSSVFIIHFLISV